MNPLVKMVSKMTSLLCVLGSLLVPSFGVAAVTMETAPQMPVPLIDIGPWFVSKNKKVATSEKQEKTVLSKEQQEIVETIHRACQDVGFFMIINHGFNDTILNNAWKASKDFFALTTEEKLMYKTTNESLYPYGYEQSETLSKGKALDGKKEHSTIHDPSVMSIQDLKETFAIGPNNTASGMPARWWVDTPNLSKSFESSLELYYAHMEQLALTLLEIFALALDEHISFFEDKMDRHMSALRLVHYYSLQQPKNALHVIRAGAHTDYGAVTILAAQDKGLEVLLHSKDERNRNDANLSTQQWYPVPLVPGAFVINLGDLMQRWTNDKWISTMHRVAMPSTDAMEERYSMAYFVNVNGETRIEPLKSCLDDVGQDGVEGNVFKYPVVTAGEHLMAKHLASMGEASQVGTNSLLDEL